MGLTGDFAKLKSWAKFFEGLDNDKFQEAVTKECAEFTLSMVRKGFGNQTDPYGEKWIPKKRPNTYKTLYGKKDKLNKFYISEVSGEVFKIRTDADYFWPHQDGAWKPMSRWFLPRRRMVPDKGDLTPQMVSAFHSIYLKHLTSRRGTY